MVARNSSTSPASTDAQLSEEAGKGEGEGRVLVLVLVLL
jgi:hypothetical protein